MKPIVKWAGGKTALLPELIARMPASYGKYWEPFAGGAALFFANGCGHRPATLSDVNVDLMRTYATVRDNVEAVISLLVKHAHCHAHDGHFYGYMRAAWNHPGDWTDSARASAFLYLNRACFNGLWRVNSAGKFNTPRGDRSTVSVNAEALRAAAQALQGVNLRTASYGSIATEVIPGDFVYLDPPYVPISTTANFTAYTAGGFDHGHQSALAAVALRLADIGAHVMLSNSDTPLVHELYAGWHIERVRARRRIAANGNRRDASEVIITSG